MGYEVLRQERIPFVDGQRIGDKKYRFRNVTVKITSKELIFAEKGRTYRYTLRLSGIHTLKLQKVKKEGKTRYKIRVNDFKFYGDPKLFNLLEAKIRERDPILPKTGIPPDP